MKTRRNEPSRRVALRGRAPERRTEAMSRSGVASRGRVAACALCASLAVGGLSTANADAGPDTRRTYLLLVFSDPVPGQEAAYGRWFSQPHRPPALDRRETVSVQHFVDAKLELHHAAAATPHDLLLYTVVTARPEKAAAAIARSADGGEAWPRMTIANVRTATFRTRGVPVRGAGGELAGAKAGPAADYLVLGFHTVHPGQDDAFNLWYDRVHLPELVSHPGVVSGVRAVSSPVPFGPQAPTPDYLVLVRIVTGDLASTFQGILHGGPPSPAIDAARSFGYTYRAAVP